MSWPTRIGFRSADEIFAGVVMLDVLHHLERPIEFLKEASRVLKPGGRLAMIEPAMTTLARRFYDRFHEEPVDMQADPFAPVTINPDRDPFDANQAIPSLLFAMPSRRAGGSNRPFRRCGSEASIGRACLPIR